MKCQACNDGMHALCGRQIWCECDCDPDEAVWENLDGCDVEPTTDEDLEDEDVEDLDEVLGHLD
jgi:hypothetical protein